MLNDFLSLIYPSICLACNNNLYKGESCICTYCKYHLPKTDFHLQKDNPIIRSFWGKVNIQSAASFYFFSRGEKVQKLIHELKYKGQKKLGITIGKMYGYELIKSELFSTVDIILPVPLHYSRKLKRGYNQSALFAEGLSKSMNKPSINNALVRTRNSTTQTSRTRFSRWKNVKDLFIVKNPSILENKHILLADDVITTGSTLEACAESLLKIPGTKVSVTTIACVLTN